MSKKTRRPYSPIRQEKIVVIKAIDESNKDRHLYERCYYVVKELRNLEDAASYDEYALGLFPNETRTRKKDGKTIPTAEAREAIVRAFNYLRRWVSTKSILPYFGINSENQFVIFLHDKKTWPIVDRFMRKLAKKLVNTADNGTDVVGDRRKIDSDIRSQDSDFSRRDMKRKKKKGDEFQ